MADSPTDPYIKKNPGDLIQSADWNQIQIFARTEVKKLSDELQLGAAKTTALETKTTALETKTTALETKTTALETTASDLKAKALTVSERPGRIKAIHHNDRMQRLTSTIIGNSMLCVDDEFAIEMLRFGLAIQISGLPPLSAAELRRACRVTLEIPYPWDTSGSAADALSLHTVTLLAETAQSSKGLMWTPKPVPLYNLCTHLFNSRVKNSLGAAFQAKLIIEGSFLQSSADVTGVNEPRFASDTTVAGGRFVVPFWLIVPSPADRGQMPWGWPWQYLLSAGNFPSADEGIGGDLV